MLAQAIRYETIIQRDHDDESEPSASVTPTSRNCVRGPNNICIEEDSGPCLTTDKGASQYAWVPVTLDLKLSAGYDGGFTYEETNSI